MKIIMVYVIFGSVLCSCVHKKEAVTIPQEDMVLLKPKIWRCGTKDGRTHNEFLISHFVFYFDRRFEYDDTSKSYVIFESREVVQKKINFYSKYLSGIPLMDVIKQLDKLNNLRIESESAFYRCYLWDFENQKIDFEREYKLHFTKSQVILLDSISLVEL